MNKRFCLLNKEFRKEYNIKMRINKCNLIYRTEKIINHFIDSPTNNWLPFNKNMYNIYIQYEYSYHSYLRMIQNEELCNEKFRLSVKPIIKTIEENEKKLNIKTHSHFIKLIKSFKKKPDIFRKFIKDLRINISNYLIELRKQSLSQINDIRLVRDVENEIIFFTNLLLE